MITDWLELFVRGWLIVTLTSLNIVLISRRRFVAAFATGCGISLVWWFNAHNAALSGTWGAAAVYALGAGCGTLTGMWLGGLAAVRAVLIVRGKRDEESDVQRAA